MKRVFLRGKSISQLKNFSRCFRNQLLFINNGDNRRNSERNASEFYWWPPKNLKPKGDSK
jgi:hypothetical protein